MPVSPLDAMDIIGWQVALDLLTTSLPHNNAAASPFAYRATLLHLLLVIPCSAESLALQLLASQSVRAAAQKLIHQTAPQPSPTLSVLMAKVDQHMR